jgi:hypothetical protein
MNKYPFINPIIITSDNGIVDGQNRYAVCQLKGIEPEYIQINFTKDELYAEAAQFEIQKVKKTQSQKLEKYYKDFKIHFRDQILHCSSEDKFHYFLKFEKRFTSDKLFWKTLGEVYVQSSNNYKNKNEIKRLFKEQRQYREFLMSEKEQKALSKLPDKIKIYRGMSIEEDNSGDFGISWTLKKDVAKMFATTYIHNYDTNSSQRIIKEIIINKSDVIAYFKERNEEEIIFIL